MDTLRQNAHQLKTWSTQARMHSSPYQSWTTEDLRTLLVKYGISIRDSSGPHYESSSSPRTTHDTLVRICEEVFGVEAFGTREEANEFARAAHEEIMSERRRLSVEDLARMDSAVRVIQRAYVRRHSQMKGGHGGHRGYYNNGGYNEEHYDDYSNNGDYDDYAEYEEGEHHREDPPAAPTPYYEYDVENLTSKHASSTKTSTKAQKAPRAQKMEQNSIHSVLRRINQQGDDYDEEIEVEWRKPSWKFAKKFEAMNRPHRAAGTSIGGGGGAGNAKNAAKGGTYYDCSTVTLGRHCYAGGCGEQLDLWNEGRTSEFSQFGSGITNYFKFLKWCCWVMAILSIIHSPILIINAYGTNNTVGSFTAATTTFGNLGSATEVNSVDIPGCDETEFQFQHCQIEKNELATIYSFIDVLGTAFFIIAWLWLCKFESKESRVLNRSTVSASDYTVRLRSIPEDTTEKELAIHFAKVTGEPVAAVHLAFNNAKEIAAYVKRGMIMQQRYKCVQRIRYEKTMAKENRGQRRRLKSLMREREDLTMLVRTKDEERSKAINNQQKAIEAFVTFEREAGFVEAMLKYHLNWFRTHCCCYPETLKFKGTRLKVEQAPEPSTIMWENLEYSSRGRFFRKCLTTSVALLAILFTVILTFLSRDFQSKVIVNASKPCPDGFFDQDPKDQLELVNNDIDLSHCYCSTLEPVEQYNSHQCLDYIQTKSKATAMSYAASVMVVCMNSFFQWLMNRAGEFEKHQSLDKMNESIMVRVFLLKFVNTGCLVLLYGQKWLQNLVGIHFDDASDFNVDWYATGGSGLMTVMLMNIVSPHVGSFVAYFRHRHKIYRLEKNLTKDKETKDSHRVWYSQEELNDFYKGPEFKLNYRYSQILVTLYVCWMYATSMPLMPLFGALSCYIAYWVDKFLFCNFYRTPPMYSDEMGKTCTSLLGYLVVLHLGMSMWMMGCEEIFHGEPLSTTGTGGKISEDLKNRGGVAAAQSTFWDKLVKKHLIPIEVTLAIFVAGILFSQVSSSFLRRICGFLRCLTCSVGGKVKDLKSNMNTVQVDYSSARDREIIKGLSSYNILQNPKYQEAFAITPEFAATHNRVSDIRGFNTKEGDLTL